MTQKGYLLCDKRHWFWLQRLRPFDLSLPATIFRVTRRVPRDMSLTSFWDRDDDDLSAPDEHPSPPAKRHWQYVCNARDLCLASAISPLSDGSETRRDAASDPRQRGCSSVSSRLFSYRRTQLTRYYPVSGELRVVNQGRWSQCSSTARQLSLCLMILTHGGVSDSANGAADDGRPGQQAQSSGRGLSQSCALDSWPCRVSC